MWGFYKPVVHWSAPTLSLISSNKGNVHVWYGEWTKTMYSKFVCSFYHNRRSDIYGPFDGLVLTSNVLCRVMTEIDVFNLVVRYSHHKSLSANIILKTKIDLIHFSGSYIYLITDHLSKDRILIRLEFGSYIGWHTLYW